MQGSNSLRLPHEVGNILKYVKGYSEVSFGSIRSYQLQEQVLHHKQQGQYDGTQAELLYMARKQMKEHPGDDAQQDAVGNAAGEGHDHNAKETGHGHEVITKVHA